MTKYLNKRFQQILLLYGSTITGVLLGVIVSVLNTRSLAPAEYGDVRYINNFIAFFSGVLLLGYFVSGSRLLAVARNAKERAELKGAVIVVLCITAVVLTALMFVCGMVHQFVLYKDYAHLFYWVLPVCSSTLLLNFINTTSQGDNSISMIAAARVFPSLLYLLLAYCIYAKWGASVKMMLWLQNGISVGVLVFLIWRNAPSFSGIRISLKALNEKSTFLENLKYALIGFFFSSITPAASGGQPMQIYYMHKEKISVASSTLALLIRYKSRIPFLLK